MAMAIPRFVALAFLLVTGTIMVGTHGVAADCGEKSAKFMDKCVPFVPVTGPKVAPSAECCAVMKLNVIPCICSHVTPELEKVVSFEKMVYVARTCGAPAPAGMKCGSYIFPPRKI